MVFDMILHLFPIAALPIVFSLIFYFLEKKTSFIKLPYAVRQIIIGLVFGGIAILATTFGYSTENATVNVRDAAPICAGLLFGMPAGIIAGLIGGVERYLATVFFGAAKFSQLACTIATCVAGIYAGLLRKFMFDNRRPSALMSFAITIVMEVIHLNLLFLTNLKDPVTSFKVVSACTIPMLVCNGVSSFLAVHILKLFAGDYERTRNKGATISETLQKYLLIFVSIAFILTTVLISSLQTGITNSQTEKQLKTALVDVTDEIEEVSDINLRQRSMAIAGRIESHEQSLTDKRLQSYLEEYNVGEINIVNYEGIITKSTNPSYVGFDMSSGEQAAEFLPLLEEDGPVCIVQPYQNITYDGNVQMKYAGVKAYSGFVQVGYDYSHFKEELIDNVTLTTSHRHIGTSGFLTVISPENIVISCPDKALLYEEADDLIKQLTEKAKPLSMTEVSWKNVDYKCMYMNTEGYYVLAMETLEEAKLPRDVAVYINIFMMIIVFAILFYQIYDVIKRHVLNSIKEINASLAKITSGHLDTKINVRNNQEFSHLSDGINSTVDTLKHYIAEAAARIDAELEFARQIQYSSLPNIFPAFPARNEFDIYATMDTAKEVGGDFYDFYFINNNKLVFMIADVSGKGIPAAMFMMTAKGIIKSLAQTQTDLADCMRQANNKLCEGNDAGLFVTAWIAAIDLETGHVEFVNCGHNPPLVRHANGSFEYLKSRPGFVLAGMEDVPYRKNEFDLEPGSSIYLYTDGVTEATDNNNELYGEDRLLSRINSIPDEADCKEFCSLIREDVDAFVNGADQFDDITMLMFKYFKKTE